MHEEDGAESSEAARVGAVELLSDLVFVFAITQLTTVLVRDRTWAGLGHVLLIFGMIWWIYGGYVWLTNAVRPEGPIRRLLLLGAMAGFLMMGLAIPDAFGHDGILFGIGYLIVVVIHGGLFTQARVSGSIAGIIRVTPFNLASAILLIVAGALSGDVRPALWVVALGIQILSPFLTGTSGFRIEPGHFVERYGLLVLIVLGESVAAVGASGSRLVLTGAVVGTSILGLVLTVAFWWIYFGVDEEQAEAVLRATQVERRPMRALVSFFYAQIPMLLGVVAVAAATRTALPHPTLAAPTHVAWLIAGGAAAYVAGDLWFRAALGIARSLWRALAVPAALATVLAGIAASPIAQLAVLDAVFIAALAAEWLSEHRREAETEPVS